MKEKMKKVLESLLKRSAIWEQVKVKYICYSNFDRKEEKMEEVKDINFVFNDVLFFYVTKTNFYNIQNYWRFLNTFVKIWST